MERRIAELDPESVHPSDNQLCRLVSFSRISRKKNFDVLLRILAEVQVPVELDIIGPVEDQAYFEELQDLAGNLTTHIVRFLGGRSPTELAMELPNYDLFVLPTRHENFGHVFVEAWAAGLPVVVSDQTPWRGLSDKGVGWDIPLQEPDTWISVLQHGAGLSADERLTLRRIATAFARDLARNQPLESYKNLFEGS